MLSRTKRPRRSRTARKSWSPALRFSPTAWAKLIYLRDYGDSEVGGFAISASDDLLFVEDMRLIRQDCSWAHVAFEDGAVADFFDRQVDAGHQPEQFARIWVHTHPGACPRPSLTDEETFARVFGRSDWAVMFILAREGQSYARLRFNVGPGAEMLLPVQIDYSQPFAGCAQDEWEREYLTHVQTQLPAIAPLGPKAPGASSVEREARFEFCDDWTELPSDPDPATGFLRS